ncbi:hypothetical protein [Nocardia exalbida]|uniref:hypothetical protein n=1 Tax=Nocardia exalbida TaxID=290231 RepID=UPI0003086E61|nr:hypothetical protein [Nocardia exalbida]
MSLAFSGEEPSAGVETAMPEAVRDVREAVAGMAGFGLAYPVLMNLTRGGDAAATASTQFCVAWALGLLVLGFAEGAPAVRKLTIGLAFLQAVVGCWAIRDSATVPPVVAIVAAAYSLATSAAVVYLLCRPEAKTWFGVPGSA